MRAIKSLVTFSFVHSSIFAGFTTTRMSAAAFAATTPRKEDSDRLQTWSERWKTDKIGWHKDNVHDSLVKHGKHILPTADSCPEDGVRVFVPLCGKTVDLAYLADQKGVSVVGLDGIRRALEEFAKEQPSLEIQPLTSSSSDDDDKFERFQGKDIVLLKGDYFDLDETTAGGRFDAIWDRASIVAIQPDLREHYVETISKVMKPGGSLLLSVFDRRTGSEEAMRMGPPFSVPEAEVRRLYEGQDWVESVTLLEEIDQFQRSPADKERFGSSGVTSLYELVFFIKAKA